MNVRCVQENIYFPNIDKKVFQADVKLFFESVCGEVYRLRLLRVCHLFNRKCPRLLYLFLISLYLINFGLALTPGTRVNARCGTSQHQMNRLNLMYFCYVQPFL